MGLSVIAALTALVAIPAFRKGIVGRKLPLAGIGALAVASLVMCGPLFACAPANTQASVSSQPALAGAASEASGSGSGESAATATASREAASGAVSDKPAVSAASAPAAEPMAKTVVCIGDSITSGGAYDSYPWPTYLQGELAGAYDDWTVVNLGVTDTCLLDEGRVPYRSTGNVEVAKGIAPDMAIVMLGTNDSWDANWDADAYRSELLALVEELQAVRADMDVVLLAPPAVFCDPDPNGSGVFHMNDAIIEGTIAPIVREVARETGAQFVDLHEFTEGHPEWFPDTVHPNGEGSSAIAAYVYEKAFS